MMAVIKFFLKVIISFTIHCWNLLASLLAILDSDEERPREHDGTPGAYYNYYTDDIDPIKQSNGLYDDNTY